MSSHNAENFYNSIAEKYHWFFSSWEGIMDYQMKSLVPLLKTYNVETVLDCACGTGLQSIGLAKAGFKVIGTDLSTNMLSRAKKNASEANVDIEFKQSDFREIRSKVNGLFDSVICMGNSIPHLMSESDIVEALNNVYQCIKQDGVAIFEMRDYDSMLAQKPRFLPMRINEKKDDKSISVLYVFDYLESIVKFNIVYLIEDTSSGEKKMEVESVDYNPIKKESFLRLLTESGFKNIEVLNDGFGLEYIARK